MRNAFAEFTFSTQHVNENVNSSSSSVVFGGEYLHNTKQVKKTRYKTIVLSDIHPGISTSKAKEVIHYPNSGDWVESMTALVETFEGEWKIINYTDWLKERQILLSTESIQATDTIREFSIDSNTNQLKNFTS